MLKHKYLAYFTLLAGWLCFCYWLYANQIYPKLHPEEGLKWPVFDEFLAIPLAFTWKSDIPIAGAGFDSLSKVVDAYAKSDSVLLITGGYYLDEEEIGSNQRSLGLRRAERLMDYFQLDTAKTLIMSEKKEVTADVRSKPFEAVSFTIIPGESMIHHLGDTLEICFPVRDSTILPENILDRLQQEILSKKNQGELQAFVIGTADGTGIAESSDVAVARAIVIRDALIRSGWNEERIIMTTGQRNHTDPIRNRCALLFFE